MNENILIRYISGEASAEEKIAIESWIKESPENGRAYKEFSDLWRMSSMLADFKKINIDDSLKKVSSNITTYKRKSIWEIWQQIAAILLPVIIIGYTAFFYYNHIKTPTDQIITTSGGNISNFELSDGSKVWLNASSQIAFPFKWKGRQRNVNLIQGEAYFEVKSNKKQPFIVHSGNLQIIATGTAFNIEAYNDNTFKKVTLTQGHINILIDNKKVFIEPSTTFIYNKVTKKYNIIKSDPYTQISWKDGKLIFRETPINIVAEKLARYYNINIIIESQELKQYTFTATITTETIEQVLNLLKIAAPIKYRKQRNNSKIKDYIKKDTFYLSYNK